MGAMYTSGGFIDQPAWFISTYLAYMRGKEQAEAKLQQKANAR